VLHALLEAGEQVLELEELAHHRGSLLGDLPGDAQPTQKLFDSALLDEMRRLDVNRTVWVEAESKKIGDLQLPEALCEAMHRSPTITIETPMAERVRLWREDYPHFAADPQAMVRKLEPLKPLVGKDALAHWSLLAAEGRIDELFESVMTQHYDPCYARSTRRNFGARIEAVRLDLDSLAPDGLAAATEQLVSSGTR
jgi:tRNA 2-selenouridine synthase